MWSDFSSEILFANTPRLVLLISAVVIPVAASILRLLPLPSWLTSKCYAVLIDRRAATPHTGRLYHMLLQDLTRGQAIFVLYLVVINIVLCIVGYRVADPSPWYPTRNRQILTYVANRTGVLSFANIPVLVLYAGRNDLLRWLTNWDHGTFIMLHSWVAVISAIQAMLHSILYLAIYVQKDTHDTESKLPYWYWGIIATLGFSVLLLGSVEAARKRAYELFLASHFALALLSFVGCYLHIYFKYGHQWGYEVWVYVAFAVWGFDRLMRLLRVARHGVRTASIEAIDDDYVRLEIEGLTGAGHAYLYFPTLTWRVWENHPFSISTAISTVPHGSPSDQSLKMSKEGAWEQDLDSKTGSVGLEGISDERLVRDSRAKLTFFIRSCAGATALLRQHRELPVLVELGYVASYSIPPALSLICLAGGVGITAVIPVLQSHLGKKKLYWSCRSRILAEAVEPLVEGVAKDVLVGGRYDLKSVLEAEVAAGVGEIVVFVSGPRSMMEDVREIVCLLGQTSRRPIRLVAESFSW